MPEELLVDEEEKPPDQESSSPYNLAQTLELDHLQEEPPSCQTTPFFRKVAQIARTTRHRRLNHLTISDRANIFRKCFFSDTSPYEWNDWQWQQSHSFQNLNNLVKVIQLSPEEARLNTEKPLSFPLSITPYYASLLAVQDADNALRRSVIPNPAESHISHFEQWDPLHEDGDSPVPGIVHRYPDRVLFLVTSCCFTYCRYCVRSRLVGSAGTAPFRPALLERAIEYIKSNPEIRDVLISGGDPLTLSDEKIEWLLSELRQIPHVEIIRIGTKAPVVLPQRITRNLVSVLKKYHPLYLSIHFTHPDELTPECAEACAHLADAGLPMGSQTVLLAGINDSLDVLKTLFQGLLRIRVKPYYLYQCDSVAGTAHFKTTVSKGLEIMRGLRGHTTGYAVPTYVIDAPGGGGKIPLQPEYYQGYDGDYLLLHNYQGKLYRYPDPQGGHL